MTKSTGMPLDPQLVELAGRNWLAAQLQRSGIEVARPERDRGIDLIAYIDRDRRVQKFIACPIQIKAATAEVFSLNLKYAKFPGLLLVYVWNVADSSKTECFALTYPQALNVAEQMGWTKTDYWAKNGSYSTTRPSKRLCGHLADYKMAAEKWWATISGSAHD